MTDWEEIKRLAADFQKVQLISTAQRLSERNCIEIVTLLREKKLIDLIFTIDGKEYLTPSQLIQEIRNELYDSGGRISLIELSKRIEVDIAHINTYINEIVKGQKNFNLILGQVLDSSYITKIATEINEKLVQLGQINVNDLTVQYDLPAEFIQQQIIEKNLNKIIFANQDKNDSRLFFTEAFIARMKAKIQGALRGLTRPTTIVWIINHIEISEKLFFMLFDQISMCGMLTSRAAGAQYIPNIYTRSQNEWVNNHYRQNNYLEYDALIRLGISDYKTYIKKHFANDGIILLNSITISKNILETVECDIDECIASKSFIDLQNNLPSVFDDTDIKMIVETVLTGQKRQQTIIIENYIFSKIFLDNLAKYYDDTIKIKAKASVDSGDYQKSQIDLSQVNKPQKFEDIEGKIDKKEERRKKAAIAGGKSGGGTQGRETKTKSTKKLYRVNKHNNNNDNEDDNQKINSTKKSFEIMKKDELKNLISSKLEDEGLNNELIDLITNYLLPFVNEKGLEIAKEFYLSTIANCTQNRRQTHNELQDKLNFLINDTKLFEKGLKLLPNDQQQPLIKYLLKTLCTDIVNEILNYISNEENCGVTITDNFNNDQRLKFVNSLKSEYKTPLITLIKSLSGQSIDEFINSIEETLNVCSMIIKKVDKKKDRLIISNHKHNLLEELNKCDDLALVLHLTILIIFITATQSMLNASGRHIAGILKFLNQYLSNEQYMELKSYHDLVTLMLSKSDEDETVKENLKEKISVIKALANEFKKPVTGDKN